MSIVTWIRPFTLGEGNLGRIADKATWAFNLLTAAGLQFGHATGGTTLSASKAGIITFNAWNHVALVWNGSMTASEILFYLNGTGYSPSTTANGTVGLSSDAANSLIIGNNTGATRTFDGRIACLSIYNRVLTAGEIKLLMYRPLAPLSGLVGLWPLWGGSTAEPDLSGYGSHGTLTGTLTSAAPPVAAPYSTSAHSFAPYQVASATVDLAASSAGTSAVTAKLGITRELAAAPAGTSSVTAALKVGSAQQLAAISTGGCTVTAALTVNKAQRMAATSVGTSTVAAGLAVSVGLRAQAQGVGTLSAALAVGKALRAASAGVSSFSAALYIPVRRRVFGSPPAGAGQVFGAAPSGTTRVFDDAPDAGTRRIFKQ